MASARGTAAGTVFLLAAASSTLLPLAAALLPLGACADPCCTVDGFPIVLLDKPARGGLVAWAQDPNLGRVPLSIDSSSPLTFYRAGADERPQMTRRSFALLGANQRADGSYPKRAMFKNILV